MVASVRAKERNIRGLHSRRSTHTTSGDKTQENEGRRILQRAERLWPRPPGFIGEHPFLFAYRLWRGGRRHGLVFSFSTTFAPLFVRRLVFLVFAFSEGESWKETATRRVINFDAKMRFLSFNCRHVPCREHISNTTIDWIEMRECLCPSGYEGRELRTDHQDTRCAIWLRYPPLYPEIWAYLSGKVLRIWWRQCPHCV